MKADLLKLSNAPLNVTKYTGLGNEEDDQYISDVGSDAEERFLEEKFPVQATEADEDGLVEDIQQHLGSVQNRVLQAESCQASVIPDDLEDISIENVENLFGKDISVWLHSK